MWLCTWDNLSDISGQILVRVEEAISTTLIPLISRIIILMPTHKSTDSFTQQQITAPIATTIAATDMAYEADVNCASYDWGAFSNGVVDPHFTHPESVGANWS